MAAPCCGRTELDLFDLDTASGGRSINAGGSSRGGASGSGFGGARGGQTSGGAAGSAGDAGASGGSISMGGTPGSAGDSSAGAPDGGASDGGAGGAPSAAIAVATGAFHSCALFDSGSVRCWGSGYYHGYGHDEMIGDDETPASAGDLAIGATALKISASWYHTCALLEQGKVRCWGDAYGGRLGYGNLEIIGDDELPVAAGDVDVGGAVTQISTGPSHSCVVLVGGSVRCWGENEDGQLGHPSGDPIGDNETPASAGDVDVGGLALQVTAGYAHSCALRSDGTVRCWGDGPGGLIQGDVDLGGSAIQVVAGLRHNCALLDDLTVRCWGGGYDGALGYGNTEDVGDDETPAEAGEVDVGGDVVELAAGELSTCALLTTGSVRCWGSGQHGQLGHVSTESIGDTETPAMAGDIDVGGSALAISAGFRHVCAVLESGRVRCWGRGSTGALGHSGLEDIGDDETPASAGDVPTH